MRLAAEDESKALVVSRAPGKMGSAGVPSVDNTVINSLGRSDGVIKVAGDGQISLVVEGNVVEMIHIQRKQSLKDIGGVIHVQFQRLFGRGLCLKSQLAIFAIETR